MEKMLMTRRVVSGTEPRVEALLSLPIPYILLPPQQPAFALRCNIHYIFTRQRHTAYQLPRNGNSKCNCYPFYPIVLTAGTKQSLLSISARWFAQRFCQENNVHLHVAYDIYYIDCLHAKGKTTAIEMHLRWLQKTSLVVKPVESHHTQEMGYTNGIHCCWHADVVRRRVLSRNGVWELLSRIFSTMTVLNILYNPIPWSGIQSFGLKTSRAILCLRKSERRRRIQMMTNKSPCIFQIGVKDIPTRKQKTHGNGREKIPVIRRIFVQRQQQLRLNPIFWFTLKVRAHVRNITGYFRNGKISLARI